MSKTQTTKPESAKKVAHEILAETGEPMMVKDLVARVLESKRVKVSGKTPEASVAHAIYMSAKAGEFFVKVERGKVAALPAGAVDQETFDAIGEIGAAAELEPEPESAAVTPNAVVLREGTAEAKPDPKPEGKKRTRSTRSKAAAAA